MGCQETDLIMIESLILVPKLDGVADPSQCNSTQRQIQPIRQNCCNFLTMMQFFKSFNLEGPKSVRHSLFYDLLRYRLSFEHGREVKPG